MKKFKFNLESVLKYRAHTEENEKMVLAGLNAHLADLIRQLKDLRDEYSRKAGEFEEESKNGMTVHDVRANHAFLKNIDCLVEIKLKEIEDQNKLIARQTEVVVRAMQDTKTLDRLKEEKFKKYTEEEQKEQEKFVEEFVMNAAAK